MLAAVLVGVLPGCNGDASGDDDDVEDDDSSGDDDDVGDDDSSGDDDSAAGGESGLGGSLVISEVMININGPQGSYVEIYNPGDLAFDLTGCTISDAGPSSITLPALTIEAEGYVVLVGTDDEGFVFWFTSLEDTETPDVRFSLELFSNNAPDDEVRLSCNEVLIDRVAWTDYEAAESNNPMQSLTLDPTQLNASANDDPANWCRSSTYFNFSSRGTPRRANDPCG